MGLATASKHSIKQDLGILAGPVKRLILVPSVYLHYI